MTLDELRKQVNEGTVDTVLLTIADMEGRLQGKRLTAGHFLDDGRRARRRGLQLPARGGRRHEHRRRLRDVELGARLRRLRDGAGLRHAAPDPVARGNGAAHGRPRLGGRLGRGGLAAADPAPPAGAARRARLEGDRGHGARVHRLPRQLRGGVAQGLSRPRAGQPLQRRLLDARHRADGAADPAHSQLDGRRGHARRELEGRVQLRPARDQLPLRRGAGDRGRPRDLQDRRQGDRRPGGHGDHLHGQARRARGQLLPHPLLAARTRTAATCSRATQALFRPLRRRTARLPAGADALLRSERQLLQALRARLVRTDGGGLGQGQPDLLDARGRATARGCAWRTGCRAPTSTRIWRSPR